MKNNTGFLLNIIASFLKWVLQPICWIVGAPIAIHKKEFNQWQLDIAYTKDVMGNVIIKYIANFLLIKKDSKHKFGNKHKPISWTIGMNKIDYTLKYLGCVLDSILEFFDPGHSLAAAGIKSRNFSLPKKWYLNKTVWIEISIAIVFVFGAILQIPGCEWAIWPIFAAFLYCFVIFIIMMVYVFLINPIKYLKEKYNGTQ